ncbi:DUF2207 domain-containing protein [Actinomadura logoneensis]|uniref:DUF2207 domain-containing protein n=1 Tax=Actinomadura logoneensis TaxID=2293572 RepID=A0A372JCE6_9ACTN|nr:DUF2207 domain-containing protein [Actinomadura logoneensis]RFU37589.1 DUF2207 domain-containing protein [Actinomadura logoneensis]
MLGRLRPLVASLPLAAVLSAALALPAHAAGGRYEPARHLSAEVSAAGAAVAVPGGALGRRVSDRVVRDEAAITLGKGGVAHVRETIVYQFTSPGFERTFTTRTHASVTEDRVWKIENVRASSPDGGPTRTSVSSSGTTTVVKLTGGAATGQHTVLLQYDVRGAVAQQKQTEEFRWTAVGGWKVPVAQARATVDTPAMVQNINCFAGALDSTIGCTQFYTNHTHTQGVFSQSQMLPDDNLTVVVGLPAGASGGKAVFERRHTAATAFSVNGVTASALGALLLLLVGGVIVLYMLRGRDARVVGKRAAEGDQAHVTGEHFEPPNGVRPGQVGTLIDEQADVIDVTATIVDLAVRGHLLIEEDDRGTTGRLDWTLRRLQRPGGDADLLRYERILLGALFDGRDAVKLSALGGTFATQLQRVRSAMYDDVVEQGWFARRPDTVRSRWTIAGMALTGLGVIATVVLAVTTDLALVGLAVIVAGAALAYGGQYMPAKTARGATVLAHTIGFRAFLERGALPETDMPSQQRIALFSRFLPYAVVFDVVDRWARTVEDAGVRAEGADNLYWYEGPAEWDLSRFAESMRTFTLATSGSISQSRGM